MPPYRVDCRQQIVGNLARIDPRIFGVGQAHAPACACPGPRLSPKVRAMVQNVAGVAARSRPLGMGSFEARRGDQPREICATAVARCAKARARPPAGTCPEGHDVEIVFQDKSHGFTRAAEHAF